MRLIALAGRAGSGKNTAAQMLGAHEISFAEPMKRFCQEVFAFSDSQVWGPSEERNRPDPRYNGLTARHALQTLGTEWGRACYSDVWAELGVRRAQACGAPLVVITDCRFVNEARVVRAAGGEVWRIVRPGAGLSGAAGLHSSETEQESPEFLKLVTRVVANTGSIEDLRATVCELLYPQRNDLSVSK